MGISGTSCSGLCRSCLAKHNSNRFVLVMHAVKPGNICFNLWVSEIFNISKLLCVYVFLNPSPVNVPILYSMKTSLIFKRGTEMEHWLKIGKHLRKNESLWFLLCSKSQWNRNRYVTANLNSHFWIFKLCKCICISELWLLG